MVIIDPPKSPNGPPPAPRQPFAPPAYTPLSPHTLNPSSPPPLRSPGIRPPPSPFSAPASNFLTIKREKADITGSWNINTSLPLPPPITRTTSADSDTSSDPGITDAHSSSAASSSAATTGSVIVPGSSNRPNLKLLSPRGKIDAAIRVSGALRAWLEAVSREEDVSISFPPNANGAPRAPIRLFARSTNGAVQVCLPVGFTGTLRVPSETSLPPSLRSLSVVLSPSEPPIERPPILDESPVRAKLGTGKAPPSPPMTSIGGEEGGLFLIVPPPTAGGVEATEPSSLLGDIVSPPAPPRSEEVTSIDSAGSGDSKPGHDDAPPSTILTQPPVETPDQEFPSDTPTSVALADSQSPPLVGFQPLPPPSVVISPTTQHHHQSTSTQELPPPPLSPPSVVLSPTQVHTHHRSVSADHRPASSLSTHNAHPASSSSTNLTTHHNRSSSNLTLNTSHPPLKRTTSNLSIQPAPATHCPSESSTVYFIGDLLRSSFDTNAPEKWAGDEFVLDSELGRVRILAYGEKAEAGWTEKVMEGWKGVEGWKGMSEMGKMGKEMSRGMSEIGKGMQLNMPKNLGLSSLGRKFRLK